MDNQKYVIASFLTAAVLVGMGLRGLALPLLARLEVGDVQVFGLISATVLVGVVAAIITFVVLNRHPLAYGFTDESITELRKVVWPSKDETVRSSAVVVGFTVFVALTLAGYDFIWARLTSLFLFTEG